MTPARLKEKSPATFIYKIVPADLWRASEPTELFFGAPVDHADGYIHFSTAAQLAETAAKHFAGHADLLVVAVDPNALGNALRWEISRGGASFPHLYAPLSRGDVVDVRPLPLGADGRHDLSAILA